MCLCISFSTRIQNENKKHVFDYILLCKDIIKKPMLKICQVKNRLKISKEEEGEAEEEEDALLLLSLNEVQ